MTTIYEICDISNDEIYFTIGVFSSLEKAIDFLTKNESDTDFVPFCQDGNEGYEIIQYEIREIELDTFANPKTVYSCCWEEIYNESLDCYQWVTKV